MARSLPMHVGSHSFEITCITCCRSPMPGRVSRAQPISVTFRKADSKVKYLGRLVTPATFKYWA